MNTPTPRRAFTLAEMAVSLCVLSLLMVAMGSGQRVAGEMASILRARRRAVAGRVGPPHGLCLWAVRYPPN